jgi:hypothetical protein
MENDEFLNELEQMTNSLDKDYNKIISTENKSSNENDIQIIDHKEPLGVNKQENQFNFNGNNFNQNQNNPFQNFGMPFANPNLNPEDCFKEFQKLLESDLGGIEDDPESKEMFKLLGIFVIEKFYFIYS